ncbi:MAG: peptidase T [Planctomycetota bacterium]|nr:MAG: peptidase T [Planctomycetota bacterium]
MPTLLDRFLRYVRIDTQALEHSQSSPSSLKQLDLSRMLADECRQMGLANVSLSEHGVVLATVPATVPHSAPAIAWVAHVDTSPETSGTDVKPVVHPNYAGGDITLPGDRSKVIRVLENPELQALVGATIVTSDGTTLLGADDKAGVAVIMTAAARLMEERKVPHGPIRLVFTCDEEIGRGTKHLDVKAVNAVCGYTLDGFGKGEINAETFSADLAVVTVTGINTHPSVGKGTLVNAIKILATFLDSLPKNQLSPETTAGRDGFVHPYAISGGVAAAEARLIVRDFEERGLRSHAVLLESIASQLRAANPQARIEITITSQYRNMREGIAKEPRAVRLAMQAMRLAGIEPKQTPIRGGTDGSLLTLLGLPTPNLSTGEHNPHSPLEWTSVEEMEAAVGVLVHLAGLWGTETATGAGEQAGA